MSVRLMIGADLVPTQSNYHLFEKGDAGALLGDRLRELLAGADFTAFNLEIPLTDRRTPIEKHGPALMAPAGTINGLRAVNPHFFTLANNHILDQGRQGLFSTIELLDRVGIAHAGAGSDLSEAQKPFIKEVGGLRLGFYCCAEHEFSIAAEDAAGANPFDPLESLDHVIELKKQCDYAVVLYHGGKEHYRYPSPGLQRICRKLVEKGADLVVCQHSHCVGAEERWKNGTIVYGQGNFLFDDSESEYWRTGLLIEVGLERKEGGIAAALRYHPLRKEGERVRLAQPEEGEQILAAFRERSAAVRDPAVLKARYQAFADTMLNGYLSALSGAGSRSFLYRAVNRLSGYRFSAWRMSWKYRKRERIAIRNYIECEAHRELLLCGVKNIKNGK